MQEYDTSEIWVAWGLDLIHHTLLLYACLVPMP